MSDPKRIQRKRTKGWRMPEGAVYVGRPTIYGNPMTVTSCMEWGFASTKEQARLVCRDEFRRWVERDGELALWHDEQREHLEAGLDDLRGKDLACWCPLDQPCHADVLLEMANGGRT